MIAAQSRDLGYRSKFGSIVDAALLYEGTEGLVGVKHVWW